MRVSGVGLAEFAVTPVRRDAAATAPESGFAEGESSEAFLSGNGWLGRDDSVRARPVAAAAGAAAAAGGPEAVGAGRVAAVCGTAFATASGAMEAFGVAEANATGGAASSRSCRATVGSANRLEAANSERAG
jgi:hypothetical protein